MKKLAIFNIFRKSKVKEKPDRFADFFLRTSQEEQLRVFTEAAHKANRDQREVFDRAGLAGGAH